jgi:hypothetical protein
MAHSDADVSREPGAKGFPIPTARSIAIARPSPPVRSVPSHPHLPSPTGMSMVRAGHPSPSVPRRVGAMWSQFRAVVARPAVWQRPGQSL